MTDLDAYLDGERPLWRGRPTAKCFILECIFNPLLFFALIWGAFDLMFILLLKNTPVNGMTSSVKGFVGIFFLIHLMPVWLYLGGVILSVFRQRNIEYAVTERGVYVSRGVFTKEIVFKPFTEISNVNMHRGVIDRMTDCGDITMTCGAVVGDARLSAGGRTEAIAIQDIPDYQEVFKLIRRLQTDIYSDTMYPNALRPENNPGYRTKYNPEDRY